MPTPPTPPQPPRPPVAPAPPQLAQAPAPARPAGPPPPSAQPSATSTNPKPANQVRAAPKGPSDLDRRTLQAARTFAVLLRNGQIWRGVRLIEMDNWSLLLDVPDQGRVLLPKHAVDVYLLDQAP